MVRIRRCMLAGSAGARQAHPDDEALSIPHAERRTVMIDATRLKAHRTVSSLRVKGRIGRLIGRTKGGMNTKLHALTDVNGRPTACSMTAGQVSDDTGAAALLDSLSRAQRLTGDRVYDTDWFRDVSQAKGIKPRIAERKSRTEPMRHDKRRYNRRTRIEIMFGGLKDWRHATTRYDRCPTVFLSAIALAAIALFRPRILSLACRAAQHESWCGCRSCISGSVSARLRGVGRATHRSRCRNTKAGEPLGNGPMAVAYSFGLQPNGFKLWRLACRFDGRQKLLAIGPYLLIPLVEAHQARDHLHGLIAARACPHPSPA
ncbi:IS5 family transposase [Ancylobacter sonchi]|uniref:IS5 family transposase n=1 Tax=Ancylobacter sonchi TaxID=1937790 RepID=UPI0028AF9B6E|nr:IS5 family transposase [Ancylobacter sonchi]